MPEEKKPVDFTKFPEDVKPQTLAELYAKATPQEREQIQIHLLGLFDQIQMLLDQMTIVCGTAAALLEVLGVRQDLMKLVREAGMEKTEEEAYELQTGDQVQVHGDAHKAFPYYGRDCVVDRVLPEQNAVVIISEGAFFTIQASDVRLVKSKDKQE